MYILSLIVIQFYTCPDVWFAIFCRYWVAKAHRFTWTFLICGTPFFEFGWYQLQIERSTIGRFPIIIKHLFVSVFFIGYTNKQWTHEQTMDTRTNNVHTDKQWTQGQTFSGGRKNNSNLAHALDTHTNTGQTI